MNRLFFTSVLFAVLGFIFSCAHSKQAKKVLNAPTLKLEFVHDLNLKSATEKGRPPFVSAASGIVRVDKKYYVVSDDEQFLFSFGLGDKFLKSDRLLPEDLAGVKDRKAAKADFESLLHLTAEEWPPYGALVAWPSGSGVNRMRAVTVPFEKNGVLGKPIISNILPLAYQIQPEARDLNIEGIIKRDKKIFLFQRGNSKKGGNAIVEMSFANWLKGMKSGDWSGKVEYQRIKIGSLSGVNLTFSDVTWTKYGLLALASAEDSVSAYADGVVYGTVLVRLVGSSAEILAKFDQVTKIEGLTANETANGLELYLVNDADSSSKASQLFRVHLPDSMLSALKQK
ncbi:MAG: hypothetical protein AABZ31_09490 [Bdellovibrionota bacterium]